VHRGPGHEDSRPRRHHPREGIRTTIPSKDGVRAGDLLDRDFTAVAPDETWVTDFTYVRSWAGWVYIAFILDRLAQRIVAWHASTSKSVELVMTPLRMAPWQRGRDGHPIQPGRLIHPLMRGVSTPRSGSPSTSPSKDCGPRSGRSATPTTNALMESVNGLYKAECIGTSVFHDGAYKTTAEVEWATARWVDWYNHRRHSSLGMVAPAEYEQVHYAAHEPVGSIT
jgi:putative transposase